MAQITFLTEKISKNFQDIKVAKKYSISLGLEVKSACTSKLTNKRDCLIVMQVTYLGMPTISNAKTS